MKVADFLSKIPGGVKPAGESSWVALCPAHEDKTPSLSITATAEKILVKCHAGCAADQIVSKLGLRMSDLFLNPKQSSTGNNIVATYDYTDESGKFLFQAVRLEPKNFRQRTKSPTGEWVWSLKGVRLVPYRLKECLAAISTGQPLYVAEGEKDCDILWKNGFCSTCNPMGAGKWRQEFSEILPAERVTVIADKDEPGRKHAVEVAESFVRMLSEVKLLQLPDINGYKIKDAYDWFSHGGKPETIKELEQKVPVFDRENPFLDPNVLDESWSVLELSGYDTRHDPNAVIGIHDGQTTRYLCKGYGAWIIGSSGIGKSSISIQQAFSWCLGKPFFGITPVRPLRILMIQNENDQGDVAESVQGMLDSIKLEPGELETLNKSLRIKRCRGITGAAFTHWMEREVKLWRADVVYVDPLLRFAGIDVSRQDQCTKFLNECIDPVLARTGVVLIGAHHTGKPKSSKETQNWTIYDFAYAGIGSSELVNWARAITIIRVLPDAMFEMLLAKRGSRAWASHPNGEFSTSIFLQHHHERIYWNQLDPPQAPEPTGERPAGGRPSKVDKIASMNLHSFCAACLPEGEGKNQIAKRLENWLAKEKVDMSIDTCKRAIVALVANAKLRKNEVGFYVKGSEA